MGSAKRMSPAAEKAKAPNNSNLNLPVNENQTKPISIKIGKAL